MTLNHRAVHYVRVYAWVHVVQAVLMIAHGHVEVVLVHVRACVVQLAVTLAEVVVLLGVVVLAPALALILVRVYALPSALERVSMHVLKAVIPSALIYAADVLERVKVVVRMVALEVKVMHRTLVVVVQYVQPHVAFLALMIARTVVEVHVKMDVLEYVQRHVKALAPEPVPVISR